MSRMYRGTEIFKPLNTGWIDGHVACVREWGGEHLLLPQGRHDYHDGRRL